MNNRITLFLMSQKGLAVLRAVCASHRNSIAAVVVARNPSVRDDYRDAIAEACAEFGIPCHDRRDLKEKETEYALAISWRWMIRCRNTRVIVLHDSLLPRYRGFAPLVSMLIDGETRIGVTALFAAEDYDRGEIIAQASREITYPIKIQEAIDTITGPYEELATEVVGRIAAGEPLPSREQDDAAATYSLWRDDDDYLIDWSDSSERIRRFIDAVGAPYRSAQTRLNGRPVKIPGAAVEGDAVIENRTPGKVIFVREGKPVVVCGSGLLRIEELVDAASDESLLPLAKFRSRFT